MGTLLLTVVLAVGAQAQAAGPPAQTKEKSPEELVMERVQKLVVRTLDGALPERTLQAWLKEVFGPTASHDLATCGLRRTERQPSGSTGWRKPSMCRRGGFSRRQAGAAPGLRGHHSQAGGAPLPPTFAYGVVMEGGASTRWIKALSEASRIR